MALTDIGQIKDILTRHGFSFSKALGQNFLVNPTVCPKMAESACEDENFGVLEIGPGIGVLTEQLSMRAKKVVSLELDKRLIPILKETLSGRDNITVINEDVLKADLKGIINEHFEGMKVAVCANLPYYITTPVIMRFLEENLPIDSLVVMVQKEFALRISSPPGNRDCGAISASVFNVCDPEYLFEVKRGSFMPMPNVDSAVIKLKLKKEPIIQEGSNIFPSLVKGAFSQRRKKAANALSSYFGKDKATFEEAFTQCDLSLSIRAEAITMENWKEISKYLSDKL